MNPRLTVEALRTEAATFAAAESAHDELSLDGVTDGKAVGTYLEHKFQSLLNARYTYDAGSSAKGIDFPGLNVDFKATSIKQPQSAAPFKSARQKVQGLGYSLLIFVYQKTDVTATEPAQAIFASARRPRSDERSQERDHPPPVCCRAHA